MEHFHLTFLRASLQRPQGQENAHHVEERSTSIAGGAVSDTASRNQLLGHTRAH
jgi:hypothetical protein